MISQNPNIFENINFYQNAFSISSHLSYFYVYTFNFKLKEDERYLHTSPIILPYRSEKITFGQLINQFKHQSKKFSKSRIAFCLSKGYQLQQQMTVQQFKQTIGKKQIDGLELYLTIPKQSNSTSEIFENEFYDDECCLIDYYTKDLKEGKDTWTLKINISNKNLQLIYLQILPKSTVQQLKKSIIENIKKTYDIQLDPDEIDYLKIGNGPKINQNSKMHSLIKKKISSRQENQIINVVFKNKQLTFDFIINKNQIITLKGQLLPQSRSFFYDQIKYMLLSQIFEQYCPTDCDKKYSQYCLKIMDMIIKPNQTLLKANIFFKQLKDPVNIVANIIPQRLIFYRYINNLIQKSDFKEFDIAQISIPDHQKRYREVCNSVIEDFSKNSKQLYFQQKKNLEPILIYTSDLKYEQNERSERIFIGINKFLRRQNFIFAKNEQLYNNWMYRYTSTLIKHLKQIDVFKGIAYRGVKFNLLAKLGEVVSFKQFISTSSSEKIAKEFCLKDIQEGQIKSLWKMHIKNGKKIKDYSFYEHQQEILLEPYSQFKVVEILYNYENKYLVYQLQEIVQEETLPLTSINFILWVDDKLDHSKQIFKLIRSFQISTILIQLTSNQQLTKWLARHHQLFEDQFVKVILITNMTRKENQIIDENAGAKSIAIMRQMQFNIPIFLYVEEIKFDENKLLKEGIIAHNIQISNSLFDVIQFIVDHCNTNVSKKNNSSSTIHKMIQDDENNTINNSLSRKNLCFTQ